MGKKRKLLLLICVALFISFLVNISYPFVFLKNVSLDLSKVPLQIIGLTFLPYKSLRAVHVSLKTVARLEKENQSLMLRLMQLQDAAAQNKRLRELLSFKQQSHFTVVAGGVIGVDASNFRRTILVDVGKKSGVVVGDPVLGGAGMIGMVIEAGEVSSRVILITDPDFSIAAKDQRSRVTGIVSGSLDGSCVFKYLDLDDDVRVGDELISKGEYSHFPFDIAIGEIMSLVKDNSGLNIFAVVKPFVRPSSLEEVLVIIDD